MKRPSIYYSTVLDKNVKHYRQGWIWAHSLIENAGVHPSHIIVNLVEGAAYDVSPFEQLGIRVVRPERFGDGAYCNKVAQMNNLLDLEASYFVLMDADTFICNSIDSIVREGRVGGKVVDLPNPEIHVLDEIYMEAMFVVRPKIMKSDIFSDRTTYASNFNGGLYIIPQQYLNTIHTGWRKWVTWILDHGDILDRVDKLHHADQIGFSMTLVKEDIPIYHVPRTYNLPCHLAMEEDVTPVVLHYHHLLTEEGIKNYNPHLPLLTQSIERANQQIVKWLKEVRQWV